jgi:signal transduction histidine kinase
MSSGAPRWPGMRYWPGVRDQLAAALTEGVTSPPSPRPARLRPGRLDLVFVADLLIAVISMGVTVSTLTNQNAAHGRPHSAGVLALVALAACAPLVLRTRFPFTAWAASALGTFAGFGLIAPRTLSAAPYQPAGLLVYGLCLYAVAVRCRPWVIAAAGTVTVLAAVVIDARTAGGAVLAAIPILTGIIVRSRRSSREQLAVVERRYEGERTLLEERQRIARELHDVVAHHMSVIAIQAEAAPYKTADPPPELAESFAEIRASALSGLTELRRLLGVLRNGGPDTAPQPGLGGLDQLLGSARAGGVTVTTAVTGTPVPLAPGLDLTAYRILQEALSNVMQHAPGAAAAVQLSYREAGLLIEVRNGQPPPAGPGGGERRAGAGGGHGIIGMRERAAMLGGHLSAEPTAKGEFLVTAYLPFGDGGAAGDGRGPGGAA